MAYIPPHKRNSKEAERPVLTPDKLAPLFKRNVNLRSSMSYNKWGLKFIYADRAISRWWVVGWNDDTQLEVYPSETIEQRIVERPKEIRNPGLYNGNEIQWDLPKSPWVYMAENVLEDLLECFGNVRKEMKSLKLGDVKPTLVARIGIVLPWSPSVILESLREDFTQVTTEMLKSWKRRFYTSVPVSYTEKIINEVVPNFGVAFESAKDIYQVELAHSTEPASMLFCKCRVKDGKLQLYKIELNQVRNMVVDMSIPYKNLDLRLMLNMKRVLTSPTDDEMQSIRDLVDSAITDPNVKGGLRWPLEKTSSGKYNVVGVWHISAKAYKNQSLRFTVRHADRFDFFTSSGGAFWDTSLRLKKVESELIEEKVDVSLVSEMLKESLKFIWDNFLTCESLSFD